YRKFRSYWEQWFPADFITECFPGQFRNWFYSLLAMSTVLEKREPFKTILGHALVRDEQGEEMHKSRGNAIPFDEAAELMGVDVMRWIFASHNPVLNLNFGYSLGNEVRRKILTLWNTFSFFSTYASIDRFNPAENHIPVEERSTLDRWLLARLNLLVKNSRLNYNRYNVAAVVREIENFINEMSNWYVRRSRRRFWKSENDKDKMAAYLTLYDVLVVLIKLIAPVVPFLTEEIYQKLVRAVDANAPESVHLCQFPEPVESLIDQELLEKMESVIKTVELGRAARNQAKIKIRQPLAEIKIVPRKKKEKEVLIRLQSQILDELNIKKLTILDDFTEFINYKVKPRYDILGPKYGKDMAGIAAELDKLDSFDIFRKVDSGEDIVIKFNGKSIRISPEEVVVEKVQKEGFSVIESDGYFVAVDTKLTDDLIREGMVRDLVRYIQNMRKEAGFNVEERIHMYYSASPGMAKAIQVLKNYIKNEVLAEKIFDHFKKGEYFNNFNIRDEEIKIGIKRVKRKNI
ncbi:MAG: DUF5915 domain-containing protein, partial [Fidelibacterota bacterium]